MTFSPGDHYAALGSSFAAGPGLGDRVPGSPRRAGRSMRNYAHLTADALGLSLYDVSFSGATTGDILAPAAHGAAAQLDAVTAATRLVTITCGGNDVGYLPVLSLSSLPRVATRLKPIQKVVLEARDPDESERRFSRLESNLRRIVIEARTRAPHSRILLVDYLTIVPMDAGVDTEPLPAPAARWGRRTADRLSETTARVADSEGAEFVGASGHSRNHDAWSQEPWTSGFSLRGGAPYHPNAEGMEAVAGLVVAHLQNA